MRIHRNSATKTVRIVTCPALQPGLRDSPMYILRALALLFLTQAVVAQQPLLEGALPFTVADLRQSLGGGAGEYIGGKDHTVAILLSKSPLDRFSGRGQVAFSISRIAELTPAARATRN